MDTIDPRDAVPLTDEGKRLQEEYRQRMKETLAEIPTFDAEQMRKDVIRIHADAIHQMGGDPAQRSYVDALTERLAAAEQRATESDAWAERLAAALEETYQYLIWLRKPIDLPDSRWPFTCGEAALDDKIRAALTDPTTQPDARAAAERAIVEKGRVWQTAEDRLRAEEERQGVDDPDAYLALSNDAEDARDDLLCVLRALDAPEGATKEGQTDGND